MSDDITAAPERVSITREKAFRLATEDERPILQILMQTGPIITNGWKLKMAQQIAALRTDLCAGVDAEGAAREIVTEFLQVPKFIIERESLLVDIEAKIAAIIRKYCGDSAEVPRLRGELRLEKDAKESMREELDDERERLHTVRAENERLQSEVERQQRTMKFWEESYLAEHDTWGACKWKSQVATARAEAIRECVEKVKGMRDESQRNVIRAEEMHDGCWIDRAEAEARILDQLIAALLEGESNAK